MDEASLTNTNSNYRYMILLDTIDTMLLPENPMLLSRDDTYTYSTTSKYQISSYCIIKSQRLFS